METILSSRAFMHEAVLKSSSRHDIYNVSRNLFVIHTIHLAGGAFKMT
jgi:hypothetical protein